VWHRKKLIKQHDHYTGAPGGENKSNVTDKCRFGLLSQHLKKVQTLSWKIMHHTLQLWNNEKVMLL
jgi:hypothetical protein